MFHPYNFLCINYSIPIRWTFLYFLKPYVIFLYIFFPTFHILFLLLHKPLSRRMHPYVHKDVSFSP